MSVSLSKLEKRTAYTLVLPAVLLVFAIVLFPIFANVWISFKDIELKDIRIPEPRAKKIVKSISENQSELKIIYKLRNSSLIQEIRNVQFQDKFPTNVSPINLDPRCNFQSKKVVCNFGNWQAKYRENFEIIIQNNNGEIIEKKIIKSQKPILSGKADNPLLTTNFTLENFNGNKLNHKISASNIRWDDSIFRLTNYVKRTVYDDTENIERYTRKDTIFDFDIEDLAPLNYVAETLNFFELNNLIRYEKRAGSPLINSHLLVRHKRYTIPLSCFILTIIAISVSSFKRRGGTGSNLAIGVSLGFLFIFLDKIFGVLVLKSNFSPAIASWGILIIFLTIALILLRKAIR